MTSVDIFGATTAVVLFVLMVGAYFYAFRPKNKKKFEELNNFVNKED